MENNTLGSLKNEKKELELKITGLLQTFLRQYDLTDIDLTIEKYHTLGTNRVSVAFAGISTNI